MNINKLFLRFTAVFIGMAIMIVELLASRVLSPYVGSTHIVWTCVIGIILLSMSVGYYLGGKIADKWPKPELLALIILSSSLLISLIPTLESLVLLRITSLTGDNLVLTTLISVLLVFSIPSVLLASVSPFIIKLEEANNTNIARTSGLLSALFSLGSIMGTFLGGLVLIQFFGNRIILLILSICLLVISLIIYRQVNLKVVLVTTVSLLFIIGSYFFSVICFEEKNPDVIEDIDTLYSRILVRQEMNTKAMQVDMAIESVENNQNNTFARYLYFFDLFNHFNKHATEVLMIGGAGYTYPQYFLEKYHDKQINVVEIDPKVTELARKHFGLTDNQRLKIIHRDGRSFLNSLKTNYDIIMIDAFKGFEMPFELTTKEAFQEIHGSLNDEGMLMINIIAAIEDRSSDFLDREFNTLKQVFPQVLVLPVDNHKSKRLRQNIILIALKSDKRVVLTSLDEQENYYLSKVIDYKPRSDDILTDDFAPIRNFSYK